MRRNPLWLKSPLVLTRFPGLLAALAVGSGLLTLAVAAYPLFFSATENKLLGAEISKPTVTRYGVGLFYGRTNVLLSTAASDGIPAYEELERGFDMQASRIPDLGPTIETILGPTASVSTPARPVPASGPVSGVLFAGTGAVENVEVIEGHEGPGVWLPQLVADAAEVGTGDRIVLSWKGRSVEVAVDGVYRSLFTRPLSGYWLRWSEQIYPGCFDCSAPPQPILLDRAQLLRSARSLRVTSMDFGWQAPLRSRDLTVEEAVELERSVGALRARMADPDDELGRLFECCGTLLIRDPCCLYRTIEVISYAPTVLTEVERRIVATEGPGRLLGGAGILVALAVIATSGAFAFAARKVEADLLFSRGAGAGFVAALSMVGSVIPCVLGGIAGLGLAFLVVAAFGPDAPASTGAGAAAVRGAGVAVLVALGVLGAVSAVSYLRRSEHHRTLLSKLSRLPWEIAIVALGIYAFARVREGAFATDPTRDVTSPSPYVLLFPILFIAGLSTLAARLLAGALGSLRARSGGFSPPSYLAVHRLAGTPLLTRLLVAASALGLGIFVQAQTMVGSLRATVDAKAKVYVGSDVQGRLGHGTPSPGRFPMPITRVTRLLDAGELSTGASFDVLAIDPESFAAAAYWNDGFAGASLPRIVRRLMVSGGEAMTAVVARDGIPDATTVVIEGASLRIEVVARTSAFPGMTSLRPLLVVDADRLIEEFADAGHPNPLDAPDASTELWVKGEASRARAALARIEYPPYLVLTADEVKDIPAIGAVIDTFLVLNTLGIAAALLVIGGMLMYLQARRRSQVVSYGLSLRMGMTHERHRRSLALELGAMLCSSYGIGATLAIVATLLVVPLLDPLSSIPPAPLFVAPRISIAAAFPALVAAAWLGAWFTNFRARSMDLAEVMRLAE